MSEFGYQPRKRLIAVPGGGSQITFGDDSKKAQKEVMMEVEDNGTTVEPDEVDEETKGAIIAELGKAKTYSELADALGMGVQELQFKAKQAEQEGRTIGGMDSVHKLGKVNNSQATVNQKAEEALEFLKQQLKKRGSSGIFRIGKKFESMDDDGNRQLDYEEFKKAMTEMDLSESQTQALFRFMDEDCNGFIDYTEFITSIRGDLNNRRKDMVFKAFQVLDGDGSGHITIDDIRGRWDASQHPDVVSGTRSEDEVLMEFMHQFDGSKVKDGDITPAEFAKYYAGISSLIDDDDYFELMIRNAWHISGGEGWCANTTCKRVLVTHHDGTQSVKEVQDDFDIDSGDMDALKAKLTEQGEDVQGMALYGFHDATAKAKVSKAPILSQAQQAKNKNTKSSIMFG